MPSYEEALDIARDLMADGCEDEYRRGIVNMLAELFAIPGVETGERMKQIAWEIGPIGTLPTWYNESEAHNLRKLPPSDVIACGARANVPLCDNCIDAYRNGIEPGQSACDDYFNESEANNA